MYYVTTFGKWYSQLRDIHSYLRLLYNSGPKKSQRSQSIYSETVKVPNKEIVERWKEVEYKGAETILCYRAYCELLSFPYT